MGAREIETLGLGPVTVSRRERRKAAVHIADRVVAEHPQLTAAELAADPTITAGLRELLAAIGINPDTIRENP